MKRSNLFLLSSLLLMIITTASSCQAIADIFKTGFWAGIIVVVVVIGLILWLVGRGRNNN